MRSIELRHLESNSRGSDHQNLVGGRKPWRGVGAAPPAGSYREAVSTTDFDPTQLEAAQLRLAASLRETALDEALRHPSRLPEWSRAHVLVHISRNAAGLQNLLLAARTG